VTSTTTDAPLRAWLALAGDDVGSRATRCCHDLKAVTREHRDKLGADEPLPPAITIFIVPARCARAEQAIGLMRTA
jgi:hypothetical protein